MKRQSLSSYREWSSWRGLGYRIKHRLANLALDVRARLAGACNASTWDESKGDYAGGYSHWRCGKARGHEHPIKGMGQPHRFNNYVWGGPGTKVEYAPIPVRGLNENALDWDLIIPFRKITDRRHPIDTLRRARIRERRMEQIMAAHRRERESAE